MEENTIKTLLDYLGKGALLIGVGNEISGDDAFGPELAKRLKSFLGDRAIDAGLAPENWAGTILKLAPEILIIADAVAFDGEPGEIRIFRPEELIDHLPSTHGPGFGALINYLLEFLPGLKIIILAVQPQATGLMTPISEPVAAALTTITGHVEDFLSKS